MEQISFSDFGKIEVRTGTIIHAEVFAKAKKPAYKLKIDFGAFGIKQSSAQITTHYTASELIGKQILAVVNFPVKQIADFMSECLVLGLYQHDGSVILITTERCVDNGLRLG
ncbi:MAG: tRNA-binding protein [Bacteroidetes bacterium]|nr:tRNA-binding protein [Bacteroidota bacterium]